MPWAWIELPSNDLTKLVVGASYYIFTNLDQRAGPLQYLGVNDSSLMALPGNDGFNGLRHLFRAHLVGAQTRRLAPYLFTEEGWTYQLVVDFEPQVEVA